MPTTRQQSKVHSSTSERLRKDTVEESKGHVKAQARNREAGIRERKHDEVTDIGEKRDVEEAQDGLDTKSEEPPAKKQRGEDVYKSGVIERGHIYFFYRPRVQLEEAHSTDEVRDFHMLLIPCLPEYTVTSETTRKSTGIRDKPDPEKVEEADMKVLEPGADAIPAPALSGEQKQRYRLITIGKKSLPDPNVRSSNQGGRKQIFWATVTAIGDDLVKLNEGLGEKTYETKTRGTRHQSANRLAGRGVYAIVNTPAPTGSKRETHLGYHLSHPPPSEMGDVQKELGIFTASSFVVQVKNPLAPATGPQPIRGKGAEYPEWIMESVFGAAGHGTRGQRKGREKYGLRFASCEMPELLDYLHAQLLMIAARCGEEGLEQSLGEGRGEALTQIEQKESKVSIENIFQELAAEAERYPAEPLEGKWI